MRKDSDKSKKIAEHLVSVMLEGEPKSNEAFDEWIKENPSARDVLDELSKEEFLNNELKNYSAIDKQKSVQEMLRRIAARRRKGLFVKAISVAAALIAISFIVYFSENSEMVLRQEIAIVETPSVRLIIDDEEVVELSKDTITSQAPQLRKTGETEIAYVKIENSAITKNRLVVPKEERFTIYLSDGTKVMLNAQSELVFPSEFRGDKREVTIHGEAFFDVSKDSKRPFIVHCDTVAIEVYGTAFNVNNRQSFSTFLLKGSIGVSVNNASKQMLLPNQRITIKGGVSKVETIKNGEKYFDWTTGYFIFDADNMGSVMTKLSDWYDVELMVDKYNDKAIITGSFERNLQLETILKSIEEVSGVQLYKKQ